MKVVGVILAVITVFNVTIYFTVIDTVRYSDKWLVTYAPMDGYYHTGEFTEDEIAKRKEAILAELGNYTKVKYNVRSRSMLIFTSYAATVVGSYTPENYAAQKEKMLQQYQFMTTADFENFKYEPEGTPTAFSIEDWIFRFIKEDMTYIPEEFRLFAFNDETQQIALLTYHDQDMDVFGEKNDEADLVDFIHDYFHYNFKK